jgi:hypothetical protein
MIEMVIMPRLGTGANASAFIGGPPTAASFWQAMLVATAIFICYSRGCSTFSSFATSDSFHADGRSGQALGHHTGMVRRW